MNETRPSSRLYKIGWTKTHEQQKSSLKDTKVVLIGDSHVKSLSKCTNYLDVYRALNLGMGGDKMEHVIWRCIQLKMPSFIKFALF